MDYSGRTIIGIVLVVIGLSAFFGFDIFHFFWPVIIILVGVKILSGHNRHPNFSQANQDNSQDNFTYSAVFNGLNPKVKVNNFSQGKISAIFGGIEIDLTDCKIGKDKTAYLDVEAVFGGVKIIVPETWLVSSSVVGVLGGFANHTNSPTSKDEQGRLIIRGSAVLGGGEVVNP